MDNPFHSAKIIGDNFDPSVYHKTQVDDAGNPIRPGDKNYVMSRGELLEFMRCPHRWVNGYRDGEDFSTDATVWGELVDCLLLTPEQFTKRFVVRPETYPAEPKKKGDPVEQKPWNNNANWCKDWNRAQGDKVIVKPDVLLEAKIAVDRLKTSPLSASRVTELLKDSRRQVFVMAYYLDGATGITVPVKCLIDLVPSGAYADGLCDFKTARKADAETWCKTVYERGYHHQGALYLAAWNKATGENREIFYHLVKENVPPYEPAFWALTTSYLEMGLGYMTQALQNYCMALSTNYWAGYDAPKDMAWRGFGIIEPKGWMSEDAIMKGALK